MKEFDLKLALDGHPLCYRNGEKVKDWKHWGKDNLIQSHSESIYHHHGLDGKSVSNNYDLMLDDSVPWTPEPKEGDMVIDILKSTGVIFLAKVSNGGIFVCDKQAYEEGKMFRFSFIPKDYWRIVKEEPIQEVKKKINDGLADFWKMVDAIPRSL